MKTANLDLLEKSELPPAQARAILQVMESELAAHDTALATKADLQALQLATKADMRELQLATKADMRELRLATKADMRELRLANQADLQALRAEIIRWNFAFWVAQLGAMAAMLKLLR